MAKILISCLGAGYPTGINESSVREYRTAKYQIDGKEYQDSFVASALYKHLELDGIIFIGTVKSIWEEVYRFFYEQFNNRSLEETTTALEYYCHLVDNIEKLNYQSELDTLNLEPIAELLGKRSQCILIKYGLNNQELAENFDRIIKVVDTLQIGDEIYIDISNSFRSLSMFLLLVISFIKDIAAQKGIKVSGVYYGMADAIRDVGYAPIVDLKSFIEVTDWIKAGYSLQTYGDSSLIAELLKNQEQPQPQLATALTKFSEAVNLGYLSSIRQRIIYLRNELNKTNIFGAFQYLKPSIDRFLKPFERRRESDFQLELAGWYFNHQRYATGYITLVEAILTYLCEIEGKNADSEEERNKVKSLFFKKGKYKDTRLAKFYKEINRIRLTIAHPNETTNSSEKELMKATNKASDYHQEIKKLFKKYREEKSIS